MAHCDGQGKPFGGVSGFLRKLWQQVWGSLAALTLLTLLALWFHHHHVFEWTEGIVRRKVLEISFDRQWQEPGPRRLDPSSDVSVVMVDAFTRITKLEMDTGRFTGKSDLVRRVSGVRPIDRCKFGGLLAQLAAQLNERENRRYLKVVGIDVDIAPLSEEDQDDRCSKVMAAAVTELRKHVAVVTIVMGRESDALRKARNAFFVQASAEHAGLGCTTLAAAESKPDSGKTAVVLQPLYLASPRVFHSTYSYPIDFPFERKKEEEAVSKASSLQQAEHEVFPSLSNLLLASAFRSGNAYQRSLTMLCDQATSVPEKAVPFLLEDLIGDQVPTQCPRAVEKPLSLAPECRPFDLNLYETKQINWRWVNTDDIKRLPLAGDGERINDPDAGPPVETPYFRDAGTTPGNDFFSAAVMILGVDGGSGYDKFVGADRDPTPGAVLHALQTLSLQDASRVLYLQSVWTLLADFCVGLVFLVAWKASSLLIDRFTSCAPLSRTMLRLVLPVAFCVGLGLVCVYWLSPQLLSFNIWANPLYLLVGLVLHAYVEGAENGHETHGPDFTFGWGLVLDLVRAHHRWDHLRPHPLEGRARHPSQAQQRRQWRIRVVDASVCAVVKLVVLIAAFAGLLEFEISSDPLARHGSLLHDPALPHWGGWSVLILLLIIGLAFLKRPKPWKS